MYRRLFLFALSALALGRLPLSAQVTNASLQGAYYLRQVAITYDFNSSTYRAYSAQGTATFDGNGSFAFVGATINTTTSATTPTNATFTGSYSLFSSGILSMTSLVDTTEVVYGGFANNVIVGSATESLYLDTLVGVPASQTATNASLNGNYRFVSLDFLNGDYTQARNATFTATANGQGSLGDLTVTGQAANLAATTTTQTINSAAYTLASNGSGTLTLPTSGSASSLLISGNKTLYASSDGNLVIGGSANGYDLIIGIKAVSGSPAASTFQGLYYTAGLELDGTSGGNIATNGELIGYYGSLNFNSQGGYNSDTRYNADGFYPYDETYASPNGTPNSSGALSKQYFSYYFSSNGTLLVGTGSNSNYEIDLGVKVPSFSGSGVFLNPVGVVNGASFAPITNPIAPGELISLFGSGLAGSTTVASALPFPNSLGGVSVTINGTAAPIYFVSPGQISVVAPYNIPTDGSTANIQVTNNGQQSNTVQVYTAPTAPGIFTLSQTGSGTGAILRQNSTVVSSSNPAKKGEVIQIYLTGLGAVTPAVAAGAAGPSTGTLSTTVGTIDVYIDNIKATVNYAGLAPGLAGLYQINAVIPASASTGDVYVDISTDDAYHTQVTVPVVP